MYRKSVPILAALLIMGGIQQTYAADRFPVFEQQEELSCAVCREQENLDDVLFLACNDHLFVAHTGCMQAWMELGNILYCPTCFQEFSEQNLGLILTNLTDGDVEPAQLAQQVEEDDEEDDEEEVVLVEDIFDAFEEQPQDDAEAQPIGDELLAHLLAEGFDVCGEQLQVQEQPQHNAEAQPIDDELLAHLLAEGFAVFDEQPQVQEQPQHNAEVAAERARQIRGDEELAHRLVEGILNDGFVANEAQVQEQPQHDAEAENCAICQDVLNDGHEVQAVVPCAHIFHNRCIRPWREGGHNNCPVCRENIQQLQVIEVH